MLTNVNLPEGEAEFFDTLGVYFPNIYDVKYLMKSCKNLKGGLQVILILIIQAHILLQEVADSLEVERIGPQHQVSLPSLNSFGDQIKLYISPCTKCTDNILPLFRQGLTPSSRAWLSSE